MTDGGHDRLGRAVLLAFATLGCAWATATVGLFGFELGHGLPLEGPGGRVDDGLACLLAAIAALIAYPLMLWGLMPTQFARSLPRVFATSLVSMALLAPLGPVGAVFSLGCSVIAMAYCRGHCRARVRKASRG